MKEIKLTIDGKEVQLTEEQLSKLLKFAYDNECEDNQIWGRQWNRTLAYWV